MYNNYTIGKMTRELEFNIQTTAVFSPCMDATRLKHDNWNKSILCIFAKMGNNLYIKIALIQP